jgi:hypothetical protein
MILEYHQRQEHHHQTIQVLHQTPEHHRQREVRLLLLPATEQLQKLEVELGVELEVALTEQPQKLEAAPEVVAVMNQSQK